MGTGGAACVPYFSDYLALGNIFSFLNQYFGKVGISGAVPSLVMEEYSLAIISIPSCGDYSPSLGSHYRATGGGSYVNSVMEKSPSSHRVLSKSISRRERSSYRPEKTS